MSVLSACGVPQANNSAPQAANSAQPVQTAQACSPGEMVNVAGSRLKQPCGSQPVQSSAGFGGW